MTNRNLLSKKIILGLATATLCYGPFGVGYAEDANDALPNIDKVAYGDVTISTTTATEENQAVKSTMDILQTTDKAIIDWNSFNVGIDATVNFIQTLNGKPNVAAMTLNRVNEAGGMSEIAGHINSIGSFILVNPNGTMFYDGSEVNAAGVVISTADIDAEQFKNGKLYFKQDGTKNENIIVNGTINASTNGVYMDKMLSDIKNNDALMSKLKENLKNSPLNLDGIQLATGFSVANNTIKLVADGDITVGEKGSLQAVTSTTISGDKTIGTEEFSVEGDSSTRLGSITLRADQNADDVNANGVAAKVNLNNAKDSQIASHSVGVYYNPDLVEHEVDGEKKTINGAKVTDLGLTDTKDSTYTQKDYTNYSKEAEAYKSKVAQRFTEFSRSDDKKAVTQTRGIQNQGYHMLVNNLYQMEAIQYSDKANMGGSYAQGTSFQAENTKYWNDGKGFKSIGSTDNVFHGGFTGHGGSNTYGIYDLTINRSDDDNIGLFGVAQKASFWSINLVDSNIIGKNNVGGIAGQATDHSKFSGVSVRKRVKNSDGETKTAKLDNVSGTDNVGGIVGELTDGTIRFSSNGSQVSGHDNVGGLAGNVSGEAIGASAGEGYANNIYKSNNNGFYSTTENVEQGYGVIKATGTDAGGLVGHVNSTADVSINESHSNGQVQGKENVGGIVGTLEKGTIQYTYNTNENATLSSSSVVGEASVGAGTSEYGRVYGTTNVGGIVGNMTGGAIDQSYNAGNVEGSTNVGGIVGSMSDGSITKAYNADNNTVLNTSNNDDAKYYGFTVKNESNTIDSYTYDNNKQTWLKNGTEQITADQLKAVPENTRMYYNRLAYRDATVTGTNNVGGVVGSMSNGFMEQVYNAGRVKANGEASNVGAFIGKYEAGTINDSFYVTTENDGVTNITNQSKAVGNDVAMEGITAKTLYEAQNTNDTKWTVGKNTANGWTIYNNSSTPLLNHFMKWININRQYEYDGTVHNLMTTDVANYYGGAFFDHGDGKDVYSTTGKYGTLKSVMGGYKASDWVIKSGQVTGNDDQEHISVYTYDNSTMWSPQHGYYTSDDARMIITPKTVTATIVGEKTYGEDAVVGVKAADGTATYISDPHSSNYSMDVTGFIGEDTADKVFHIDRTVAKYNNDKNQLGAGEYTNKAATDFTNPTFTNKDKNYNYKVEFKDTLKVNKANLIVDIVGTKTYGDDVSKGSYSYYAHGQNSKNEGSDISADDVINNGSLKSWEDKSKFTGSITVNSANADKNVTHNDKDTGSTEITQITDVIVSESGDSIAYNLSEADITSDNNKKLLDNYNLVFATNNTDTSKNSVGKLTIIPKKLTVNVVGEKIYGEDKLASNKYHVEYTGYVDGDKDALSATLGNNISYTDDNNKLAAGTYTDDSKFEDANPVINNLKFENSDKVNNNYKSTVSHKLTVKKADLYINVDGSKQYGDGIKGKTASYTYYATSKNEANADHTATDKDKLNDGSLKSWDTISSSNIDKSKVTSVTANADVYHNDVQQSTKNIGDGSNVITDSTGKIISYGVEKMSFATGSFDNLKNYNVIFKSGTMTVTPAKLKVTSIGTKNFGDDSVIGGKLDTTTDGKYNVTVTGLQAGDTVADSFTYNFDEIQKYSDNKELACGTYNNPDDFNKPVFTAINNRRNYDITFEYQLTVKPSTSQSSLPFRGSGTSPSSEPTTTPASEPTTVPASEPTTVPASEPTTTPASEPTTIPANEPATTPAIEPTTVPANEPTTAPASKPADNSNTETFKIPNDVIIEINKATEDINTESKKVDEERKKIRYDGYNPKEARDGIRFITVEDTGINVEDAKVEHTTITIEPDSLVDENSEIIINGSNEAAE
ncbi:filamentous hemagglutinin N-terminal domain-containing protein [Anaerovibrio lipolyticus]|uniref:filamentous hemagglutinin N-terminal domain-containing protein n=1 Tax=Anaerovibrio lipolyticus TaxID=82374 RepID=UPI000480C703|nr:filamentous hemagglutinin N-terminal domain-containing protein [Anaerovibrio lipolyticus]